LQARTHTVALKREAAATQRRADEITQNRCGPYLSFMGLVTVREVKCKRRASASIYDQLMHVCRIDALKADLVKQLEAKDAKLRTTLEDKNKVSQHQPDACSEPCHVRCLEVVSYLLPASCVQVC
jgi:hypothetical protein